MGALLTSILQGAGRAGGELQEAKTANLKEKQNLEKFKADMAELQARLKGQGIQQQRESAPKVVYTYRAKDGIHNIVQNPLDGSIKDQLSPGPPEMSSEQQKIADMEAVLGRPLSPEEKQIAVGLQSKPPTTDDLTDKWAKAQKIAKDAFPNDPKKALEFARSMLPGGASATKLVFPSSATSGGADSRPISDKAKDIQSGTATLKDFPTKERGAIATYLREHKMNAAPKFTAQQAKLQQDIKLAEPLVGKLEKLITDSGLEHMGEGGMFSLSAMMDRGKVEKAWQEYSHGLLPKDQTLGAIIKAAAALKIRGAAPWMTIGRGKYLYQEIVQHLPEPNDTPALLLSKAAFFKDVLEDAKGALPQKDSGDDMLPGEELVP